MMTSLNSARPPRGACNCGTLRKASRRMSQLYDLALAPSRLKCTQFGILAEIERAGTASPLTLSELATAMVMDRSTLGHNLRPLQRDRLVVMRPDSADRRRRHLVLTPKGRAACREARALWRAAELRFERVFGKRPAAQLRAVLHGIATNPALGGA
jgi:DNA-binding MarR family transcriptional regulator